MLKSFSVTNYKNFKNELKFNMSSVGGYRFNTDCIYDGIITKMLVYGRNATGKTNLGTAIMDIKSIILGYKENEGVFINADAETDDATFAYEFEFGKDLLHYSYRCNSQRVLYNEKLEINGKMVFDIDFQKDTYNVYLKTIHAESVVIDRYKNMIEDAKQQEIIGKQLPFLRWLINNAALNSASPLIKLYNYAREMRIQSIRFNVQNTPSQGYDSFYDYLSKNGNLHDFEEFLNEMGIACELMIEALPDGKKELYFKHKTPISFVNNASSGTIALLNLYRLFIAPISKASFYYMDEFDAFYHYEMSDKVIQYIKMHFPKCQFIMTTHNTNLMNNRIMRPDCLMILSSYGTLTALCDATERELREGHNLEKMYISGEFERFE